jgi:hypothetical protein
LRWRRATPLYACTVIRCWFLGPCHQRAWLITHFMQGPLIAGPSISAQFWNTQMGNTTYQSTNKTWKTKGLTISRWIVSSEKAAKQMSMYDYLYCGLRGGLPSICNTLCQCSSAPANLTSHFMIVEDCTLTWHQLLNKSCFLVTPKRWSKESHDKPVPWGKLGTSPE